MLFALLQSALALDWAPVQTKLRAALADGLFSGAYLGVADSQAVLFSNTFGTPVPQTSIYESPVTPNSKWDLDDLTAQLTVVSVFMNIYQQNKSDFRKRVTDYIGAYSVHLKQNTTLQNLFLHNSGLTANESFTAPNDTELIKQIANLTTEYKIGSKFSYSPLNWIILGECIKRTFVYPSFKQAVSLLFTNLGLFNTQYAPPSSQLPFIVPSNFTARGFLQGVAADPLVKLYNGSVAPHAGLFGTGTDLLRFMRILLNKGSSEKIKVFQQQTVTAFTTRITGFSYNNTRALGFETIPNTKYPPCGTKFSSESFGMESRSGSFAWVDKKNQLVITFLVSTRSSVQLQRFRSQLSDLIFKVVKGQ